MNNSNEVTAEFLASIVEHVADPIFVKNREFRFVLVNQALCSMVGYPREALIGKTDYDFFPKNEADFFRAKDSEMFSTESTVTVDEEPITDAAGQVHILATTKMPLRGADGQITHLVGIIHDITKIKQAEETLRNANEQLEERVEERTAALASANEQLLRKERLAVLGKLAGGLAHQLRNPLGVIQNAVSLLTRASFEETGDAERTLAIISEEVMTANRIITDLLDYARVRPAEARAVIVRDLIEDVLDTEDFGNLEVVRELPLNVVALVDPHQVQAALGNVVRNAIEAMPAGGTVYLRTWIAENRAFISVRDTGGGVLAHARAKLFEPLVTTKQLGIGLGLSTARALIENQGLGAEHGTIVHKCPPEGGAEFVIELPATRRDGSAG